jgi:hypothetical protein
VRGICSSSLLNGSCMVPSLDDKIPSCHVSSRLLSPLAAWPNVSSGVSFGSSSLMAQTRPRAPSLDRPEGSTPEE